MRSIKFQCEELVNWIDKHLDEEQVALTKKSLASLRRNKRFNIDSSLRLYEIKDELKARFKAKWCSKGRNWHVHYKKEEAVLEFLQSKGFLPFNS